MVFLRKTLYIGLALLIAIPALAKKPQQPVSLTTEQQQQFKYYWYAAKQAIEEIRYADAMVLLTFCEQLNPNDGTTLDMLGVIYMALEDQERGFDYYRRAQKIDPCDQWYHYTKALLASGSDADLIEAQAVMEQALAAGQNSEELLEQLKRFYINDGKWKKALAMQDRLDAIKGFDAYSAVSRYHIYSAWKKEKKGIAEIEKLLEQDPNNSSLLSLMVLNNYAYYLATHKGDLKKAEKLSELTIREQPNNPVYLDTYGWIMHLLGQDELALFYLNKALYGADSKTRTEVEKHLKKVKGKK